MSRFILISNIVGKPDNGCYTSYPRGSAIASDGASALPGDWVWPAICTAPSSVNLRPLDAAASAVMGLPITTLAGIVANNIQPTRPFG